MDEKTQTQGLEGDNQEPQQINKNESPHESDSDDSVTFPLLTDWQRRLQLEEKRKNAQKRNKEERGDTDTDVDEEGRDDVVSDVDEEVRDDVVADVDEEVRDDVVYDVNKEVRDDVSDVDEEGSDNVVSDVDEEVRDDVVFDVDEEGSDNVVSDVDEEVRDDVVYDVNEEVRDDVSDVDEEGRDDVVSDVNAEVRDDVVSDVDEEVRDDVVSYVNKEVRDDVDEEVRDDVGTDVDEEVRDDVGTDVDEEVRDDVGTDVDEEVRDDVGTDVDEEVRDDVGTDVDEEVRDDVGTAVDEEERDDVGTDVDEDMRDDVGTDVDEEERDDVGTDVDEEVRDDVGTDVDEEERDDVGTNVDEEMRDDVGTDVDEEERDDVGTDVDEEMRDDVGTDVDEEERDDVGTAVDEEERDDVGTDVDKEMRDDVGTDVEEGRDDVKEGKGDDDDKGEMCDTAKDIGNTENHADRDEREVHESDEEFDHDDETKDPDFRLSDSNTDDSDDDVDFKDDPMIVNTLPTTDRPSLSPIPSSLSSSGPSLSSEAAVSASVGCSVSSVSSGIWAKKHACVYCQKLYAKISRHFEDMHSNELEVALALGLPKRSQERNTIWTDLRNRGDYNYNKIVIAKQEGEMIPCKRPTDTTADVNSFVPCAHCKGMFQKNALWRHIKRCRLRSPRDTSRDHQKQGKLLMPVPQNVTDSYKSDILGSLAVGKVRQVAANDALILQFGQTRYSKCRHQRHQHQNVRQQVRELGRFLIKLRDRTTCQCLEDCIDPQHFNEVVHTVRDVCGFQQELGVFSIPTLAQHIGQSLLKCAKIMKSNALKAGDSQLKLKAEGFIDLYDADWTAEIGTFALNTIQVRRFNKPKAMPLARDIRKLNVYLAEQAKIHYDELQVHGDSVTAWKSLNELTLTQIVLFNRRRGGEAERAEMSQYLSGTNQTPVQEDLLKGLSQFERNLTSTLARFEIRGKRGRRVAVLLTSDYQNQLACLLKCRAAVGVEDNKYLFPRTEDATTPVRGCDVIRKCSRENTLSG
ncbi:hypothetical protein V1264_007636 [Littorina saxatilis]|uniref:Uncharacterized protein n=1 Tax=Littorina saxatilis TaxID=31220 RepID=A0AAN9AVR6_9CAEN